MSHDHDQYNMPSTVESLDALNAQEADLREHIFGLVSDYCYEAIGMNEAGRDFRPDYRGGMEEVILVQFDSIYPVLREDHSIAPHHLTLVVPTQELYQGITRMRAEWDIQRSGKHAEIIDHEG